jgi:hypothetical protein
MRNGIFTSAVIAAGCGLASSAAHAGIFISILGDPADYKIFLPGGVNQVPVPGGGSGMELSVNVDNVDAPGTPYNESRAIYQFDISSIASGIQSATFSAVLDEAIYPISSNSVDVYGSTLNRSNFLLDSDPLAGDEFAAASYVQLNDPGTPFVDKINNVDGERYFQDITGFLQDRYDDYLADTDNRWVFFRLQCDAPPVTTSSFYDFNSGDAAEDLAPRLDIVYVPGPGAATVLGCAWLMGRGRRRARSLK